MKWPDHTVTVPDFFIMDHEVTIGEHNECVLASKCKISNNKEFADERRPAYNNPDKRSHPTTYISWDEAQDYIHWKNSLGYLPSYRLCSEAEWEYAVRAGTTTKWFCGDDKSCVKDVAWASRYRGYGMVSQVKTKKANPWGLYDMHGNAWEWVQDHYHENYENAPIDGSAWEADSNTRVLRGGSSGDSAGRLRSSNRISNRADQGFARSGFRLCADFPILNAEGKFNLEEQTQVLGTAEEEILTLFFPKSGIEIYPTIFGSEKEKRVVCFRKA